MSKKTIMNIIVFIMCLALGYILPTQFNQTFENNGFTSLEKIEQKKDDILKLKGEIKNYQEVIKDKKLELITIEAASNNDDMTDYLENEIEQLKLKAGFVDVMGQGVMIKLDDTDLNNDLNNDELYGIVHDIYLSNIVNELRIAGAEAISINKQRILATSEINCGGPVILINNRSVANPFIIEAIGDPKKLYNAISGPNGYGTYLKEDYNLEVYTQMSDIVLIKRYNGVPNFKYLKLEKVGD